MSCRTSPSKPSKRESECSAHGVTLIATTRSPCLCASVNNRVMSRTVVAGEALGGRQPRVIQLLRRTVSVAYGWIHARANIEYQL